MDCMNLQKETAHRRFSRAQIRLSAQKMDKKETLDCDPEKTKITKLLEDAMTKYGENLVDCEVVRNALRNATRNALRNALRNATRNALRNALIF